MCISFLFLFGCSVIVGVTRLHTFIYRLVFAHAYAEVRHVVETNLMARFVSSEGFKAAAQPADTSRAIGYFSGPIENSSGMFHEA